ncbi:MAG: TVP38/TMEM64 family protein, partial [Mycobacterium leprae]
PWLGTCYSLIGGMAGAAINFLLARRIGTQLVRRTLGDRWVDLAGRLGPVHLLVLSLFGRLIPVASFDAVAYVAGISQISLTAFLGVALLGQTPAFLAYAYFGSDLTAANHAGLISSLLLLLFVVLLFGGKRLWRRISG